MILPRCLTIAGSDSGGGAGIQADLKTFEALGCFGMSAITAITAQNTREVRAVQEIKPEIVRQQIEAVAQDIGVDAVKTGMLFSSEIIQTVSVCIQELDCPLVVDPVMVAKSGAPLLQKDAVETLRKELLPYALLVTPNIPEAEILTDRKITTMQDRIAAGRRLAELCPAVLLKGGHDTGEEVTDILFYNDKQIPFTKKRRPTKNTHGTGCALSSAITAEIAKLVFLQKWSSEELVSCMERAQTAVERAIAYGLNLGTGNGPIHALAPLKNQSAYWECLQEVREALCQMGALPGTSPLPHLATLIPEVGSNFAVCTPYALTLNDVAGVEGRIVRTGTGIKAVMGPWMGVSGHVGRLLLTMREYDSSVHAAMNIRFSESILANCQKLGWTLGTFDRKEEPPEVKAQEGMSLIWGVRKAMENRTKALDAIYDYGDIGREPMIRLFAPSAQDLAHRIQELAKLTP